jgi:RNA polymerase sigma-70 factor (ECF subfamily)
MNGGPLDDVAFMARLARGDLDGVRALYGRFGRPLYAYVNSLVDDEALAEEVVQDTFVAAWRSAARFENRSSRQAAVVAA